MSSQRIHRTITADGVAIAGTVHGHGPPLVFLHGIIGDGDLDWRALVPHLTGRFSCHLPSMRGRGLSGDHPDLALERVIDDFVAYADSLGEPARLVGWSGGANWALAAAARSNAVAAVAPYEPVANSQMDAQEQAALGDALSRMRELAAEGDLPAAARAFASYPFNDHDLAVAEDGGYFQAAGRYAPHTLNFFQRFGEHDGPMLDDPIVLGAVSVPVLVVHGTDTKPFMAESVRHVAAHVPDARTHPIPGAGHAAPLTHPEALAGALTEFFSPT